MPVLKTSFRGLLGKSVTHYCRWLINEDVDPKMRLEIWRDDKTEPDLIVREIGLGANVMLRENNQYGPDHVKYRSFPQSTMPFLALQ